MSRLIRQNCSTKLSFDNVHFQHDISMKRLLDKMTISITTIFIKTDGHMKMISFYAKKKEFIWTYEYMIII